MNKFKSMEDFDPKIMGRSLCMSFDAVVSSFAHDPNSRVNGALSSYIYDMPQYPGDLVDGGLHYSRYVQLPTSFIPQKQPPLLESFASTVQQHVGSGASFFDLGPGPEWSVVKNTIPALRILKPLEYVAIDIELEFTTEACAIVSREFPNILVQGTAIDFHSQPLPNPKNTNSIIWYPGSTLGNLPIAPDKKFTENQFVIEHLKRLCGFGNADRIDDKESQRYLVLLMDSRKDNADSMVNLYVSPEAKGCFLSILYKLKRDLQAHEFQPELFSYRPCWNEFSSVVEHQFTALENQTFSIKDCFSSRKTTIKVPKGEIYSLSTSMKPSLEEMKTVLSLSGWEPIESEWDAERQFHIHLAHAS